jgi:hypothetical protein
MFLAAVGMAGGAFARDPWVFCGFMTLAVVAAAVPGIMDLAPTILKLLGLEDHKLTFYHAGRFKQLSQFGGIPSIHG